MDRCAGPGSSAALGVIRLRQDPPDATVLGASGSQSNLERRQHLLKSVRDAALIMLQLPLHRTDPEDFQHRRPPPLHREGTPVQTFQAERAAQRLHAVPTDPDRHATIWRSRCRSAAS